MTKSKKTLSIVVAILIVSLGFCATIPNVKGQKDEVRELPTAVTLLPIELPLSSAGETKILESLEKLANRGLGADRPIVVLEFQRNRRENAQNNDAIGRGTSFERALGLARWLSGPKGGRIRSVGFIPQSITGHAVLIALGCEEIAISPSAEIGKAAIDEIELDATVRQAYLDVASKRGTFPEAAVLSLIDPSESLVRLDLANNRVDFWTLSQLKANKRPEGVWNETQLVPNNQMAVFVGQELRGWRWVAHLANDREQLGQALKLAKPLTEQPVFEGERTAVRMKFQGVVTTRQVNRIIRAIDESLQRNVNLILIEVDSTGGNLVESMRLAQYLSNIPSDRAEVVAFINGSSLGDSALVPLACDTILMHPDAKIGGPGEASISPELCHHHKTTLQELAKAAGRSDGELLGCICQDIPIFEYSSFDGRRQLTSPKWLDDDPNVPQWHQGRQIPFESGLSFPRAQELMLANDSASSMEAVGIKYGIQELPDEMRSNATERAIEWLASQGWVSMLLVLIGVISLSAEMSSPGIGIAGITSGICFLLFFWIHWFQGTVEWLEILLILAGVLCLFAEIFFLPGFGVFGVTGILLLVLGLLLVGQTFVWPTNEYQWHKTMRGMGQLGLLFAGIVGTGILFRKQIANLPMIRWMSLQPPREDKELLALQHMVEELQSYVGWNGVTISRCNPSGKATIGDKIFSVSSEDAWIDENTDIQVVSIHGNTLIVRPRH